MKKILCLCFLFQAFFYNQVLAQTVVVTDDATYTTGAASSVLDVKSTTKGFLVPRMTAAQRTAVTSPTDGLLVYQTDGAKGFYNYNSTLSAWVMLGSASTSQWGILGNAGTAVASNFLGTTDNMGLRFKTNGIFRMVIDTAGSVGIGSVNFNSTFREKLLVDAGTTTSVTALYSVGTINNYFQLNIRNLSNGTSASSDLIATADNGSETTNYVDLGINGSGYTPSSTGKPDDGYLISNANDFYLVNLNTTKDFIFENGPSTSERMRLTSGGFLGIGTASPATALHVYGVNPLTLGGVQLGATTDSILTISSGTVRKLPFSTPSTGAWSTLGNTGTAYATNYLGTTDKNGLHLRTNNVERMYIDSLGHIGIGIKGFGTAANPAAPLVVKDTLIVQRTGATGSTASLLFTDINYGNIRIAANSGDIFWQGGAGNMLQMGSYWTTVLMGDRQTEASPAYITTPGVPNLPGTGVLVPAQRALSVPLAVQAIASQTANMQEWRNSSATPMSWIDVYGNFFGPAVNLTSGAAANVPVIVTGISGQTGDLQDWNNSSNTILSRIDANGVIYGPSAKLTSTAVATIPLTIKGFAGQTGDLQDWTNSSSTVISKIDATGNFTAPSANLNSGAVAGIPLIVKGFAGQTGDLTDWKTSAGVLLSSIDKSGNITAPSATLTSTAVANIPLIVKAIASQSGNLQEWRNSGGTAMSNVDATGNFNGPAANLTSTAVANVPLTVKGIASQTGDLAEFKNSAGTVLSAINAAGQFTGSLSSGGSYGTGNFGATPSGGTAVTSIFRTTVNTGSDNTSITQTAQHAYTFTVTGMNSNCTVIATPQGTMPLGFSIAYTYTSGTNLGIVIQNVNATANTMTNFTFNITVIQ